MSSTARGEGVVAEKHPDDNDLGRIDRRSTRGGGRRRARREANGAAKAQWLAGVLGEQPPLETQTNAIPVQSSPKHDALAAVAAAAAVVVAAVHVSRRRSTAAQHLWDRRRSHRQPTSRQVLLALARLQQRRGAYVR